MGDKRVSTEVNENQLRSFTRAVLNDLNALEQMLTAGRLEEEVLRIGAEQEMFLVDSTMHPAPIVLDVLKHAGDDRLTTEIGQFNIEANVPPIDVGPGALNSLSKELTDVVDVVRGSTRELGGHAILAGILPTIQASDLVERNLTPQPRYLELNRVLTELHGCERLVHIKGLDELRLHVKDTFIEFCNTSFQVHLQVGASDFVKYYNWAQAVAGPVLAASTNSPLLLGHRLWHESRVALFQHAVDERSPAQHERRRPARVTFGRDWVRGSILDLFHEDVARFRIIFTREIEEDSMRLVAEGKTPELLAWRMHNGTIWRWNRACYGVLDGKPSLRIEARFLPSGPTVADEVANAAFFIGLVLALPEEYGDVANQMTFDDAKSNFFSAARFGLDSQLHWIYGKSLSARRLILEELLPTARRGLQSAGIDDEEINRHLGVLEARVNLGRTGSQWMLNSLASMDKQAKQNVKLRSLTAAMRRNQENGAPLHEWPTAEIPTTSVWIDNYKTVEQFMVTDLFTVRPEDVVDLAANLMHWKHVRHVPVEDIDGRLAGIVSHRDLLELYAVEGTAKTETIVRDVMKREPITVSPETSTLDALLTMREKNIGCLPVVKDDRLVGIITAHDFLTVSARLLEERLRSFDSNGGH